ncbi:hypothetical protein F4778DRAFT_53767 [Xylariomycetidae sp. FL2044]|nr:hypothetical protein F4778DRAFT_53767 [Xylariomycetidae sp. FL2044]
MDPVPARSSPQMRLLTASYPLQRSALRRPMRLSLKLYDCLFLLYPARHCLRSIGMRCVFPRLATWMISAAADPALHYASLGTTYCTLVHEWKQCDPTCHLPGAHKVIYLVTHLDTEISVVPYEDSDSTSLGDASYAFCLPSKQLSRSRDAVD